MKKSKLRDFDPESLLDPAPSSSDGDSSDSSSEADTQTGREHYQDVGKSKLRKREAAPLGKQYSGASVSRDAIENEDSDDPFARGYDTRDSEDEDEEDEQAVNGGGIAHSEEEEEEAFEGEDTDFDEDEDAEEEDESGEDEDYEDDVSDVSQEEEAADQTTTLREMMKDTTLMSSTISQAAKSDVEKGKAIQAQRKTFDTLLNSRIRLQKTLISTNALSSEPHKEEKVPDSAIEAAELASLKLLNTLADLRSSLEEARGIKRKRRDSFTSSTPSREIFSHIQNSESDALPERNQILEKWSNKTRGASTVLSSGQGRLNASTQQTLVEVLSARLQDTDRLVKRSQVARSCAPNMESSEQIYDDADWYGILLRELLEQRSTATSSVGEFVTPWEVSRASKARKVVDTKASKGRKLRYTIHEKLENLMAPESRNSWGERQREELFSALFGKRSVLDEGDDIESDDGDMDIEEEGLMLFRS